MPTGTENSRSKQYAFRLPHDLDAQLETYMAKQGLSRNRAVIDLLAKALAGESREGGIQGRDSPSEKWDSPSIPDEPGVMERLAALEATLAALQPRPPAAPQPQSAASFDETKHYLGPLCDRGHDWQGTGQSRRSKRNQTCMACEAEAAKARRARNKARYQGIDGQ
jgi:hypothetical protein